jgi:hypothetical protein
MCELVRDGIDPREAADDGVVIAETVSVPAQPKVAVQLLAIVKIAVFS